MGRPPRARTLALEAARRIVVERGAGALTFEEVAATSGVTRGGITYHFPTKQALLRALVEEDIAQWNAGEEALAPGGGDRETDELIAAIRLSTGKGSQDEHKRFVSGMLSAVTLDPSLLEPCRAYFEAALGRERWDERRLRQLLLRLAADGLFWMEVFRLYELPPPVRAELVALMERLAADWSGADVPRAGTLPDDTD